MKNVRFKTKSLPDGVTAVITYNDIPNGGENIGSKTIFGTEPLFADEITRCAGQCLAFVVILLYPGSCMYFDLWYNLFNDIQQSFMFFL